MKTIECSECSGSGFSGQGSGYDSVCDNCGGKGELPAYESNTLKCEISVFTDKKQTFSDYFEVSKECNYETRVAYGLQKLQPILKLNNLSLSNIISCKVKIVI